MHLINKGKIMNMYSKTLETYDYGLVSKKVRETTDVAKFSNDIFNAIKAIVPNAQNIKVVKDGYSFGSAGLNATDLRMIGRQISKNCELLCAKARVYKSSSDKNQTSRQIFKRR